MVPILIPVLIATVGTWFATLLGASSVFLLHRHTSAHMGIFSGSAAGVMFAASFWSLLLPAAEQAERHSQFPAWIVVTGGLLLGCAFLFITDQLLYRFRFFSDSDTRCFVLIAAITLHNIPEGLAVGVAFAFLSEVGFSPEGMASAISVAVGIGLQNIPEGAAVSLPLVEHGFSRRKSFLLSQATGIVEPLAGCLGAFLISGTKQFLPWALSFAAGTMIWVSIHDLIPDCQEHCTRLSATVSFLLGFVIMSLLDIALV